MNGVEAPFARISRQSRAQVLIDEQLELIGEPLALLFKA
jgi:hypothetical protein